ncbi:MAG: DNA-binding transcriptional ArsR family regulator [Bradymonadia bacterium]|jgi:DNA-binding transcriptional ArsR family regulator
MAARVRLRSPKLDYDVEALRALADDTRQSILQFLCTPGGGEMLAYSVTEIADNFALTTSTVSHHLQLLRRAGLVEMEKAGKERLYSLDLTHLSATIDGFSATLARIDEATAAAALLREPEV